MDDPERLKVAIDEARESLSGLERDTLLTADPIARKRLKIEIDGLKRSLFKFEKRLGALSGEPLRLNPATSVISPVFAGALSGGPPLSLREPQVYRSTVFVSYSQADRAWSRRLLNHLKSMVSEKLIDVWDEARIESGARWHEEIELTLASARVAVLLVSASYLASDDVLDTEIPLVLDYARDGGLLILPIIISPCAYDRSGLREVQAVNSASSPLIGKSLGEQEKTFAEVSRIVARHLDH